MAHHAPCTASLSSSLSSTVRQPLDFLHARAYSALGSHNDSAVPSQLKALNSALNCVPSFPLVASLLGRLAHCVLKQSPTPLTNNIVNKVLDAVESRYPYPLKIKPEEVAAGYVREKIPLAPNTTMMNAKAFLSTRGNFYDFSSEEICPILKAKTDASMLSSLRSADVEKRIHTLSHTMLTQPLAIQMFIARNPRIPHATYPDISKSMTDLFDIVTNTDLPAADKVDDVLNEVKGRVSLVLDKLAQQMLGELVSVLASNRGEAEGCCSGNSEKCRRTIINLMNAELQNLPHGPSLYR
ncbi:hypothetical protein EDB19DRAFT_1905231 [Suillus lakei]|nr:hypothetical protein EDB19DRAFT_1905231 [Suillus lakei]